MISIDVVAFVGVIASSLKYPHPGDAMYPTRNLTLSLARTELAGAAYNGLYIFAGGLNLADGQPTDIVEVFDLSDPQVQPPRPTILHLSEPKMFDGGQNVAVVCQVTVSPAVVSEGRAYIAGGTTTNGTKSATVDVFDFATKTFVNPGSLVLSAGRSFLAVTAFEAEGLVLFGGGELTEDEKEPSRSSDADVVDVYSVKEGKWLAPAKLSVGRKKLTATTVSDRYAIFAGGFRSNNGSDGYRDDVDIYDLQTKEWTSSYTLSVGRMRLASGAVGGCAVFAGGEINVTQGDGSGMVDVFCFGSGGALARTVTEMSVRRYELAAAVADNSVCFGGGNIGVGGSDLAGARRIDCIDVTTLAWKKANMKLAHVRLAAGVSRTVNSTGGAQTEVCWGGGGRNTTVECFAT